MERAAHLNLGDLSPRHQLVEIQVLLNFPLWQVGRAVWSSKGLVTCVVSAGVGAVSQWVKLLLQIAACPTGVPDGIPITQFFNPFDTSWE